MIWAPGRHKAQSLLVAGLYEQARGVPCEHRAVMAGGLPGADKTAALTQAGVDRARYLTVSIDTVLLAMAERGLIPAVEGLSPLEAADLAHTEAQFVAKRLALRGLADGRNLLLDITMASRVALESWLDTLHRAGYSVTGVFVDIPVEESVRRIEAAHRRGLEEFRARRWPPVPPVCPPGLEAARAAIDDPEPYVPGSFDDVVLAYDLGKITDAGYQALATAAAG